MKEQTKFRTKRCGNVAVLLNRHASQGLPSLALPIIFVHGMSGNKELFTRWLKQADDYGLSACAIDLRGHGETPCGNLGSVTLEDYMKDIETVIDHTSNGGVILGGHSMGGLLVRETATKDSRVKRVISITSAPEGFAVSPIKVILMFLRQLGKSTFRFSRDDTLSFLANRLNPEEQDEMLSGMGDEAGAATRQIMFWRAISPINCPGLVLSAGMDRITPPSIQRGIARKHGSRLVQIEEAGHMLQIQAHDGVSERAFDEIARFAID